MRKDMSKLLCERPRIDSRWGDVQFPRHMTKDPHLVEYEDEDGHGVESDAPKHLPMKGSNRGRGSKMLNENLSPLYKFLEGKVGQHWDKVYSEIRENINTNSAIHMHIMQHLWQYVTRHVKILDDKKVCRTHQDFYGPIELGDGNLYIHPKTKVLCRYKRKNKPSKKPEVISKKLSDKSYLCKFKNGIWYRCDFDDIPVRQNFPWGRSKIIHPENWNPPEKIWYRQGIGLQPNPAFGTRLKYKKQQLSSKELRKYGLENDR